VTLKKHGFASVWFTMLKKVGLTAIVKLGKSLHNTPSCQVAWWRTCTPVPAFTRGWSSGNTSLCSYGTSNACIYEVYFCTHQRLCCCPGWRPFQKYL